MGELTIEQRRNNSITNLEYIKSYLSAILKPSSAKIVIPMLDDISEALRDSVADATSSPYYNQLVRSLEEAVAYKNRYVKGKVSCIVFSPHRRVGENKLFEIASSNKSRIFELMGKIHVVTDTEIWTWDNPENDSARGHRATKAFVDMNCSKRAIDHIVFPSFIGDSADFRYF